MLFRRILLTGIGLLAVSASALAAEEPAVEKPAAEELEWDQEKVTTLAEELRKAVDGVRQAFRQQLPTFAGSGEGRSRHRLSDLLRRIEGETRHLASELKAGKGHDETLPVYEQLIVLVRDAQEQRRRIFMQKEVLGEIDTARGLLEQLDAYYDAERPLPPAPMR